MIIWLTGLTGLTWLNLLTWLVLPSLGLIVGILSGLLGIGGGVILVPMLIMIFPLLNIDQSVVIHLSLGSALATATMTLSSSILAHHRNGIVDFTIFARFLPGIVIGAIIGPSIVHLLPVIVLRIIIGLLLFLLAFNMSFDYEIPVTRKMPSKGNMVVSGLFFGLIASFAGLSGAALIVPYLIWFGVSMHKAVGIAALCGLPLSIIGMITYMFVGYGMEHLPYGAIGYVYWPAVISIALTSVPAAQFAGRLSSRVPKVILKRLLAILFTLVGSKMLFF
jgi:uncharacterized membrane protein YfcA